MSKNINSIKNYKTIIMSTDHDYYKKSKFDNDLVIDLRNFFKKNKKYIEIVINFFCLSF